MSKNNDFDSDRRPDLNEYLSKEITQYYGEDVINDIENSSAPIPPKQHRNSRWISALGICCAVMFLTGAVIFSGVFFTTGISVFKNGNAADSDAVSNASNSVESNIHSAASETFPDTDSNSISDISSSTDNFSLGHNYDSDTSKEDSISEIFTDTDNSSDCEGDNNTIDNILTDNDTDANRRTDYFSLPEYPDEGNISEIDTDVNNNSETNPNDNVTTGKKYRAGVGIVLMILSLITAFVLNLIRNYKEA